MTVLLLGGWVVGGRVVGGWVVGGGVVGGRVVGGGVVGGEVVGGGVVGGGVVGGGVVGGGVVGGGVVTVAVEKRPHNYVSSEVPQQPKLYSFYLVHAYEATLTVAVLAVVI